MKIESIIKRDPPTLITLGNTHYQFEVDENGRHVVEVTDQAHLARLLAIPEGYRLYIEGEEPVIQIPQPIAAHGLPEVSTFQPVDDDEEEGQEVVLGSNVHPSVIDLGNGKTVQLGEIVQQAFAASGMTMREWNDQDEDDRYAKIDAVLDALAAPAPEDKPEEAPAELDREALAKQYEAKFGHRPNGKLSAAKIQAALNEASA